MKKYLLSSLLMVLTVLSVGAAEFYVAPDGKPTNTGSAASPWDLQTALNHPTSVKPGDTIWLRNGIHRLSNRVTKFTSRLAGTSSAPITVRQYPGERATIDGNIFQSTGGWVNYWGFEIYNSNTTRYTSETGPWPQSWMVNYDGTMVDLCVPGIDMRAPNVKMINLVIHDSIGGGFSVWRDAVNAELYGCLSYYNGWQAPDRSHGHGIYTQNATPSTKNIKETIFYGNLALNVQAYGSGPDSIVDNFNFEGNVMYKSSILATSGHQQNFLIGPNAGQGNNDRVMGNFVYDTTTSSSDNFIGYVGGLNNPVIQNNYFASSAQFASAITGMTLTSNVFAGGTVLLDRTKYPNNTYSRPTSNLISVHPNQYESGRANIVIYNWQKLSTVSADVSKIGLNVGDTYELHNSQNFYGDVITGTYNGGSITIPMTGRTVAKPQGSNFTTPASTFPEFGTFVITKKAGGTTPIATNTSPVISTIANQTINQNKSTAAIAFTVSDKETPAANLTVAGTSSNTNLVPNVNIVFGGSGTNRTVTLTPATNQTGTATVTIQVKDGTNTTSKSFVLTVLAVVTNTAPTISTVANQTVASGDSTAALTFAVSDSQTAATSLSVTATSANQTLVPNANIALGGSGTNRTVTVKTVAGQSGSSGITLKVSDGSLFASSTFTVSVSTNSTGTGTNTNTTASVYLGIEAEDGVLVTPMVSVKDSQLTTRQFIQSTNANQGTATYSLDLPKAGTYVIWAKVLAPTYSSDSFFVSVDGQEDIFDASFVNTSTNWQWSLVNGRGTTGTVGAINPRTFNLSQGKHTIIVRGREARTGLDRLIITDNRNYTPKDVTAADDVVPAYAGSTTQILPGDLLQNDVSLFGDTLTISAIGTATNGTVVLSAGSITYTPKAAFIGNDTFTYTVKDDSGATSTAKVSVNVQVPTAVHLGFEAEAGLITAPMTLVTNGARKFLWTTTANQGSVSCTIDIPMTASYVMWAKVLGATYASDSVFVSVDGLEDVFDVAEGKNSTNWQWSVVNGRGTTGAPLALNPRVFNLASGKHTILIRGREVQTGIDRMIVTTDKTYVPKDVVAMADTIVATAGISTSIGASQLLANDIALFQDPLTLTRVSTATNGTVTLSGSTINYTPNAGFIGQDSFTYTVSDAQGGTATATVTVTVQASATAG